jgi:hypothetical protein
MESGTQFLLRNMLAMLAALLVTLVGISATKAFATPSSASPASSTNNTCEVSAQSGPDWGARVMACVHSLASSGGLVDATGTVGAQTCTTPIVIPAFSTLRLGAGTTISGACQVTLTQGSAIEGMGGVVSYGLSPSSGQVTWEYTASSGNFISIYANGWHAKLANVKFVGPLALGGGTGAGNGLYVTGEGIQPGLTGPAYGVAGLTLDHVTFQGFYGDGIHLEDNVYLVECWRCASFENGGNGWYQSANASTQAPNQVQLYAAQMIGNGILSGSQIKALGAGGAGEIRIYGGSIANDIGRAEGNAAYCVDIEAGSRQQMNAWLDGAHMEGCGSTSGSGAFIYGDIANGVLTVHDTSFVSTWIGGIETKAPALIVGAGFSSGVLQFGPGNKYNFRAQHIKTESANMTGTASFYDQSPEDIGGSGPGSNFSFPSQIAASRGYIGTSNTLTVKAQNVQSDVPNVPKRSPCLLALRDETNTGSAVLMCDPDAGCTVLSDKTGGSGEGASGSYNVKNGNSLQFTFSGASGSYPRTIEYTTFCW